MGRKTASNRVLILSNQRNSREAISQCLGRAGFQCDFSGNFSLVTQILKKNQCGSIIHDWQGFDQKQSIEFQAKIAKTEEFLNIPRLLLVEEMTSQLLAIAMDYGIRRLITKQQLGGALSQEISMVLWAESEISELLSRVRKVTYTDQSRRSPLPDDKIDKLIEDAFVSFPNDSLVRTEFGTLLLRRNELTKAKQIAEDLLTDYPTNVRAMNLLAKILMKENKFTESIEVLERANILSPHNCDRLIQLGETLFTTGETDKAGRYFNQALQLESSSKEAKAGLAKISLSQEDFEAALNLFQDSFTEQEIAGYFNNTAIIRVQKSDFEKAFRLYQAALSTLKSPKIKSVVYYNLGLAYRKSGNEALALSSFESSLMLDATNEKSLLNKRAMTQK